uniref:EGF-like domain-containing protein n=1 Tax=Heterorhabditis bacteriophora TaxID=37862 RepID=A0A1I7XMA8_HETBA
MPLVSVEGPGCDITRDCSKNADCVFERTSEGGKYKCICQSGYSGNGNICVETQLGSVLPPLEQPGCDQLRNCDKNAQCVSDRFTRQYRCECYEGFAGDGITCVRIHSEKTNWEGRKGNNTFISNKYKLNFPVTLFNQCNPANPTSCQQNAECVFGEIESAYVCKCITGFSGDGFNCVPFARPSTCLENPRLCHANAQCVFNHERNSHICICKPGSVGDGYNQCTVQGWSN